FARDQHPVADCLAMSETPIAGNILQRVRDCVPEIENPARPMVIAGDLFSLIAGDDGRFEPTVRSDGRANFFGTHASGVWHAGSMHTDPPQQAHCLIEQFPITCRSLFDSFAPT